MKRFLMFDLDDTILDFHHGEIEGVKRLLTQYGVRDVAQGLSVYKEINQKVWRLIEDGFDKKDLLNTRFSKTFIKFDIAVDGIQLEKEYREILDNNYRLIEGAKEMLISLRNQGYSIIAATNGVKSTQIKRLRGSEIIDLFDDIFVSEDIGFSKPNVNFFKHIFENHPQINSSNSVMIGDRLESDILGANRVKMQNIWFNLNGLKRNSFDFKPDYEAKNYQELISLIKEKL